MAISLPEPGEMLTMAEAGKILGISGRTVLRMAKAGKLKAVCYGPRMWRVSREALAAYLEARTVDEAKASCTAKEALEADESKSQAADEAKSVEEKKPKELSQAERIQAMLDAGYKEAYSAAPDSPGAMRVFFNW